VRPRGHGSRARTLQALEVSESKNGAILQTIPDTICLLDADGRITELLGYGDGPGA
jgi:PAS domain-containing protein